LANNNCYYYYYYYYYFVFEEGSVGADVKVEDAVESGKVGTDVVSTR
jgi:hypothetical protein